jgi:Cys-tRNA(Pro)/Cys-tRNA(Cys) deacylase
MAAKPPGARILEQRRIAHDLIAFDPAIRDAGEVARAAGHDPATVFKTLVVEEDPPRGKPMLVMAPATAELDLKAFAAAVGIKRARMASHADAERHTGLKVGGISAVALAGRGFRVYLDASANNFEHILVSAGQRGFDVRLSVADLVSVTGAVLVEGGTRPL